MGNIISLLFAERQKKAFLSVYERPKSAYLINDFYLEAEDAIIAKIVNLLIYH